MLLVATLPVVRSGMVMVYWRFWLVVNGGPWKLILGANVCSVMLVEWPVGGDQSGFLFG